MARLLFSDERLRVMYTGGRADATARRLARLWAAVFSLGLAPGRWVTLEVAGRRSGRPARFPLGMADLDGQWFLVPVLGGQCSWVQTVRAAHGRVIIRHGRAVACTLAEIPVGDRPPVLKRYLQKVPGARPHIRWAGRRRSPSSRPSPHGTRSSWSLRTCRAPACGRPSDRGRAGD